MSGPSWKRKPAIRKRSSSYSTCATGTAARQAPPQDSRALNPRKHRRVIDIAALLRLTNDSSNRRLTRKVINGGIKIYKRDADRYLRIPCFLAAEGTHP